MLTALVAFLEATYPPETKHAKRIWAATAVFLAIAAIVLVIVQVDLAAKDRQESEKETEKLNASLRTANEQLKTQGDQLHGLTGGVRDLKKLMQLDPTESPDRVLAAAAAKILDLDKRVKDQGQQVATLERKTASRKLGKSQSDAISDAIKASHLTCTIQITSLTSDAEGASYGEQFVAPINNGGWSARPLLGSFMVLGGIPVGVSLKTSSAGDPCAEAFAGALGKGGLPHPMPAELNMTLPSGTVELMIGRNPDSF
jgi:hypothetical protein